MDLRPYLVTRPHLLDEGLALIEKGKLWYQPFILADGLEVGEGQNLENRYAGCMSIFDHNVFAASAYKALLKKSGRKFAENLEYFRACNQRYRLWYVRLAEYIDLHADLSHSSVLEIGCNTGLLLFYVAKMGASECIGVDWTDYASEFCWLNNVLNTNVAFYQSQYDNLAHRFDTKISIADVVVNTVFLNHQSDPLHCLATLADHARKGLMLCVLSHESLRMDLRFGTVEGLHDLGARRRFPLSLHNDVSISKPLLLWSLRELGFNKVEFFPQPECGPNAPPKAIQPFLVVYATRTNESRSALFQQSRREKYNKEMAEAATPQETIVRWLDISGWRANGLSIAETSEEAPTRGAKATRLIEDVGNTWRNVQTRIYPDPSKSINVSVEIRSEQKGRRIIVMVLTKSERFACAFDPETGSISTRSLGNADLIGVAVRPLGRGWSRLEMVGRISVSASQEDAYLAIAIVKHEFDEVYLGDGVSGLELGAVTWSPT